MSSISKITATISKISDAKVEYDSSQNNKINDESKSITQNSITNPEEFDVSDIVASKVMGELSLNNQDTTSNVLDFGNGVKVYLQDEGSNMQSAYYSNGDTTIDLTSCMKKYFEISNGNFGVLKDFKIDYENNTIEISTTKNTNLKLELTTGNLISLEDKNKIRTYYYDSNGNIIDADGFDGDIFNAYNIKNEQYGGNQMDFFNNPEEVYNNPEVQKILNEKFPTASYADKMFLLTKLGSVGCVYIATVNSIFLSYKGKEDEFENDFGFSMYTVDIDGNVDFNYEPLVLNYFLYENLGRKIVHEDGIREDLNTIEDLYGNILGQVFTLEMGEIIGAGSNYESTGATGLHSGEWPIDLFLKDEYGIELATNIEKNNDDSGNFNEQKYEEIKSIYGENVVIAYGSEGYDLYEMDSSGGKGEIHIEDGGGHSMIVTGFTDAGDIIVSSYGKPYILDISDQSSGTYTIVSYN